MLGNYFATLHQVIEVIEDQCPFLGREVHSQLRIHDSFVVNLQHQETNITICSALTKSKLLQ